MRKLLLCILGLSVVLLTTWGLAASGSGESKQPPHPTKPQTFNTDPTPEVGYLSDIGRIVSFLDAIKVAEDQQHLAEYISAVQAAEAEQYAQEQARQAYETQQASGSLSQMSPAPIDTPHTDTSGGSCYGGPIPDDIVTRESGGNPMAENASGAFGCYQIMPEWWSGACSHLDKYTIDGQKACAAILWNGGAGASNWALTR